MKFLSGICIIFTICVTISWGQEENSDSLVMEPDYGQINIKQYLKNDQLLRFQLKCILFNGPCDIIGHWIKRKLRCLILKIYKLLIFIHNVF